MVAYQTHRLQYLGGFLVLPLTVDNVYQYELEVGDAVITYVTRRVWLISSEPITSASRSSVIFRLS